MDSKLKFKGSDRMEVEDGLLTIYLVWSFDPVRGGHALESVSLSEDHARYAKACAEGIGKKVMIEPRYAEHLFGGSSCGFAS